MTEVFKCGDIASIINNNYNEIKSKKRSKLDKKFNSIIEENRNKVIEINKNETINERVDEESDEEVEDEDNEEIRQSLDRKKGKQTPIDSEEKNQRTAFVGNLPKSVTKKILKKLFKNVGPIDTIRLRSAVPQKEKMSKKVAVITKSFHSGKDNINAYIVFKSRDDLSKALLLNGTVLEGHHIRVDSAIHDTTHDNTRSVFVGNLPFVIKEDEIYEFFSECGDIEAVRVVRDSASGVGKGFGFITFKSKDSVVLALEKNEAKLLGRELRVTRAKTNNKKERHSRHKKNSSDETETTKKSPKKVKKSDSKPEFEGITAKRMKKKTNKKKEILSKKSKTKQKKLAQIFSH